MIPWRQPYIQMIKRDVHYKPVQIKLRLSSRAQGHKHTQIDSVKQLGKARVMQTPAGDPRMIESKISAPVKVPPF